MESHYPLDVGMDERPRFYGTDVTETFESIAEATLEKDGTISLRVVLVERISDGRADRGTTETGAP